jgi:uncharacterized repeat protein (TIGR01451 family)
MSPATAGCTVVSNVLNCSFGDLVSGAVRTVRLIAQTSKTECATYPNIADAHSDNDGNPTANATIVCQPANLGLTKTADATPVNAGDQIGFTLTLTNNGTGTAKNVTLHDPLPSGSGSGLTWTMSPATAGCTVVSNVLNCSFGDLASGAVRTVHLIAQTSKTECATYPNIADAHSDNDGNPTANATIVCQNPSVHVVKTADAASVNAGSNIGFTLTVRNTGVGLAHGVVLTDTLPTNAGLSWTVNGGTAAGTCSISLGILTCNIGDLAAGASVTVHITSPTNTATCGTVNNTGTVTSGNDSGDSSSASVAVNCITSSIQPTQTTCQQFLAGSVPPLTQLQYGVKGNPATINNVSPGVFFYYVIVHATTAGSKTVVVKQSIVTPPAQTFTTLIGIQSISVFTAPSCGNVSATSSNINDPSAASITFNAAANSDYVIQVKYKPSSLAGVSPVPNPTTVTYQYQTASAQNSAQTVQLVKK